MLTVPVLAELVYRSGSDDVFSSWAGWVTYSPLHFFWAAQEAVYVFFVLSGLVLTLPVLKSSRYPWREYYPKRIVRLYAPVVAAVAFGVILVLLAPRTDSEGLGPWLEDRPTAPTPLWIFRDLSLVAGPSRLISPLWSLQWEVLFSLLLPAYIVLAARKRSLVKWKLCALLAVVSIGSLTDQPALIYLPMFGIGALMAVHMDALKELARGISSAFWWGILVAGIILTTARWTLPLVVTNDVGVKISVIPAFLGCTILVAIAAFWQPARTMLETPVAQWLGRVSFSLYLTHEPIIIALGFAFNDLHPSLVFLLGIPLSLIVAWGFFKYVESPSHSWAQRIGLMFRSKSRESVS
jgi:peptidoglycan/LPS O-acetylase OafA/YrhL